MPLAHRWAPPLMAGCQPCHAQVRRTSRHNRVMNSIRDRLLTALVEEKLLTDPSILAHAPNDPAEILTFVRPYLTVDATNFDRTLAELTDSVAGLERARSGVERRYHNRTTIGNMEQLIWEGHPKHPCAKTTLGLGCDGYKYLPEQSETIPLKFVAVPEHLTTQTGQSILSVLPEPVRTQLKAELPAGFAVIPVHPWQLEYGLQLDNDIRVLHTTINVEPLLSVRTLRYQGIDIKTSVNFQLTGAIRGISDTAIAGPIIAQEATKLLANTAIAPYTTNDTPAFNVAQDLAGIKLTNSNQLGAIIRQAPTGIPVAALTATNPLTGELFIRHYAKQPVQWLNRLAEILVLPCLRLLDYGLALEPHPQNTVLELKDGWPYAVTVRDYGGCRIIPGSQFHQQRDWSFLAGTALLQGDAQDKLLYPMITNLLLGLCAAANVDPAELEPLPLPQLLPQKRVFAMRLSGAVTEQDYVRIPNPIPQTAPEQPDTLWAKEHVRQRIAASEEFQATGITPKQADIDNAVEHLAQVKQSVDKRYKHYHALGYETPQAAAPPSLHGVLADSLAVTGHNVHPLAKLRKGFSLADSAAYGPENFRPVDLKLIGFPPGVIEETGDFDALLKQEFPVPDTSLQVVPVHPWQWEHVIAPGYPEAVDLGVTLPVIPTLSMRTGLSYHPGSSGKRWYIKTAIGVVLTSTKRDMSRDSALNTPTIAAKVAKLVPAVKEVAGCAHVSTRDLSTLLREHQEDAITAAAIAESGMPFDFASYARELLGYVLPTMWHHGIAIEAHRQNTLITPDGIKFRDFSGLRIYSKRCDLGRGIVRTDDHTTFSNKGIYAAFLGNLAGMPGLDWQLVRSLVDDLIAAHQPPPEDIAALLAPRWKQKAFIAMSLAPHQGDKYFDVANPLVR